jgi:FkbM family methyltransferase
VPDENDQNTKRESAVMTFISYAQNLEDVMLWRVFKYVKNGFYIDVGAHDPVIDSVTKAFYERDWRGINIEPVQQYHQRLCQARPHDINLAVAAGAEPGELPYYEIPDSGLSTLDSDMAEQHKRNGWTVISRSIPVVPLASICECHAAKVIHFLKIDVEGAERQVLLGMDFHRYRPWVVLVEATIPTTQVENYAEWENILLAGGYQYVYFDGLNRFYVAVEKVTELQSYFSAPPNVFDAYQRYAEYSVRLTKQNLEGLLRKLAEENQLLMRDREMYAQEYQRALEERDYLLKKITTVKDATENSNTGTPRSGSGNSHYDEIALLTLRLRQEISRRRT